MGWYRNHPQARMYLRALALAVAVYICKVFQAGVEVFELVPFLWGIGSAIAYTVLGFLSPLEPMVGWKTDVVVPEENTTTTSI